jgi:hypothetical protein
MRNHATAMFEVKAWDETPVDADDRETHPTDNVDDATAAAAPRLTRATVTKTFTGDLEGAGVARYVVMHRADGTSSFVGQERVVGRLADRTGSFVLEHRGTFEGGMSRTSWTVVPGSGTGELRGLQGKGGFASAKAKQYPMTLEYELI